MTLRHSCLQWDFLAFEASSFRHSCLSPRVLLLVGSVRHSLVVRVPQSAFRNPLCDTLTSGSGRYSFVRTVTSGKR